MIGQICFGIATIRRGTSLQGQWNLKKHWNRIEILLKSHFFIRQTSFPPFFVASQLRLHRCCPHAPSVPLELAVVPWLAAPPRHSTGHIQLHPLRDLPFDAGFNAHLQKKTVAKLETFFQRDFLKLTFFLYMYSIILFLYILYSITYYILLYSTDSFKQWRTCFTRFRSVEDEQGLKWHVQRDGRVPRLQGGGLGPNTFLRFLQRRALCVFH